MQAPLLHTLEEYTVLRREREEEKRRSRACFIFSTSQIFYSCFTHDIELR